MSFLGFGRPQPTSAEKIAAVEAEMKLIIDMQNRYAPSTLHWRILKTHKYCPLAIASHYKCRKLTIGTATWQRTLQTQQDVPEQVHPQRLPRGRAQQGRERVPGPVRRQVLRRAYEGLGHHDGRTAETTGRRRRRRLGHVNYSLGQGSYWKNMLRPTNNPKWRQRRRLQGTNQEWLGEDGSYSTACVRHLESCDVMQLGANILIA